MSAIGEAMQSVMTNGQNSGGFTLWDPVSQTGSGLIGQLFAGANARRQWRYQQKAMALQQKYALEQMQKQSDLNQALWQYQFDAQNKYNDPTAVFARYGKAGVTPAGVLGQSGVGVNATMPGGSGSATSGASGPSAAGLSGAVGSTPSMDALANMQAARSVIDRNKAAANLDNAQAQRVNDENLGSVLYKSLANSEIALNEAVSQRHIKEGEVLGVQKDLLENDRLLFDLTVDAQVEEIKARAQRTRDEVIRLGIENSNLGRLMSAQAFMMETQAALNNILGQQAAEVIKGLKLNNIDTENELARNWEKRFEVEVPNPRYSENLHSKNPITRANPGPTTFKMTLSLKDFYDKTAVNTANASEFLPEQARIALRNAKLDPYVEISKALIGVAGSVAGAGIIRGGMSRAAGTISTGGSSNNAAGSSMTTRYDSHGNVVGYAKTEMSRSGYSSSYNNSRHSR